MNEPRYFEDFKVGQEFCSSSLTLTDAKFELFAAVTRDSHPIHHDVVYAAEHGFGRPVAHGLLLTSLMALGASDMSPALRGTVIGMVSQSTTFLRPAFVGTTLTPRFRVARLERKSRAGLIELSTWLVDEHGDRLAEGTQTYLIRYRPAPEGT